MLNDSLFEIAIKIKKGELYQFTPVEKDVLNVISLVRLVPMIYNYTLLNLRSYTVRDMLKKYLEGTIKAKTDRTFISEDYENIHICNRNETNSSLNKKLNKSKWNRNISYYDNVIYEKAFKWYTYYDNDLVGIETNLVKNKRCRRLSLMNPNKLKEFYVATLVHMKFCFEKLGYHECYRIVEKSKTKNKLYDSPSKQEKIKPSGIQFSSGKDDLGDHWKIKYTPLSLSGLTIQDFREAYNL